MCIRDSMLCDAGEPGIPNITVNLYLDADGDGLGDPDELVATTTTDITGNYLFPDLGPGAYVVEVDKTDVDVPDGYVPEIELVALTLTAGQNVTTADFPFIPLISKEVSKTNANPGDTLYFTVTLNYQGSDLLDTARVIDPLPAGTTYVAASANMGGTYGAFTSAAGQPGFDDQGTFTTGTTLTASPITVIKGGTINVSMVLTSTQAIASVTPSPLTANGGTATCSAPSPASANVPAGGAGAVSVAGWWATARTSKPVAISPPSWPPMPSATTNSPTGRLIDLLLNTRSSVSRPVSYTHLRAHETVLDLVCRLLLEKKTTQHIHTR